MYHYQYRCWERCQISNMGTLQYDGLSISTPACILHLFIAWVLSRDDQVTATPISVTPFGFSCILWRSCLEINTCSSFPQWTHSVFSSNPCLSIITNVLNRRPPGTASASSLTEREPRHVSFLQGSPQSLPVTAMLPGQLSSRPLLRRRG